MPDATTSFPFPFPYDRSGPIELPWRIRCNSSRVPPPTTTRILDDVDVYVYVCV